MISKKVHFVQKKFPFCQSKTTLCMFLYTYVTSCTSLRNRICKETRVHIRLPTVRHLRYYAAEVMTNTVLYCASSLSWLHLHVDVIDGCGPLQDQNAVPMLKDTHILYIIIRINKRRQVLHRWFRIAEIH